MKYQIIEARADYVLKETANIADQFPFNSFLPQLAEKRKISYPTLTAAMLKIARLRYASFADFSDEDTEFEKRHNVPIDQAIAIAALDCRRMGINKKRQAAFNELVRKNDLLSPCYALSGNPSRGWRLYPRRIFSKI